MSELASRPEPRDIPIGLIDPPELPARMSIDEDKFAELVASIRKFGIIQRLILARKGDRYEVIAGHRRYLAAVRANLAAVPADVFPSKVLALEGVKHAENRFREDLTPAEEAVYFDELLKGEAGGDVDRVCALVGEKRAYVEDRLLLFQGCERVFRAIQENKIKLGVASELNKVTDARVRSALLYDAIASGATVALVRGWVTDWKRGDDLGSAPLPPREAAAAPSAVPQSDYFTCICCGGTDNVHLMLPVNVHGHCKLAILDKLIAAFNNPG